MTMGKVPTRRTLGAPPFDPRKIPGLQLYLRSDLGITLNGSNVSGWADQSGKGNHFVQGTALNQPAYTASAINGRPGITGDSANSWMNGPVLGSLSGMHLFIVAKVTGAAAGMLLSQFSSTTDSSWYLFMNGGASQLIYDTVNTAPTEAKMSPGVTGFNGATKLYEAYWDGATMGEAYNEVPLTGTPPRTGTIASIRNMNLMTWNAGGTANRFIGHIALVLLYDHRLSAGNQASVHSLARTLYAYS